MKSNVQIIEIFGNLETLMGKKLTTLVQRVVTSNPQWILLDLRKTNFVDSGGLGALVKAFKTTEALGISLVICTINSQVESIFKLTAMDTIFTVFEDREQFYQWFASHYPIEAQIPTLDDFEVSTLTKDSD